MRASRLVSLLLLLQTRGRMTAAELADELEVSVRTVYRDVESLHAAGVPLYGDAGPAGGYQLLEGYRTRLTGLTRPEAEALFLAGLPGPAAELGLGSVVAAAQLKLAAALPPELRDHAERVAGRFHLDTSGWYREPDDTTHLAAVADAVWRQHRVEVGYHRWTEPREVTRTLSPYGLVVKSGTWYLIAHNGRGLSTYRVSAIRSVHALAEPFDRPADFDLAGHWRSTVDEFERRQQYQGKAVVLLSAAGRARVPGNLPAVMARAVADTATPADRPQWIRAVIPIESIPHAATELLRLGAEIEVLEPPELRQHLTDTIAELARMYRPR
ncbi:helix-turn-helix transcriptional regulator [Herbihabitans rhizosphaerae]|uniref:helix-turn-helix transcriptional regulator n=1 Tax=Herbihabitans rhizosphaerae TaxID=1872711 RepID=UPI00102B7F27|nr:WYL domain-containing protein [Herbihabitans rhizosphaerae]